MNVLEEAVYGRYLYLEDDLKNKISMSSIFSRELINYLNESGLAKHINFDFKHASPFSILSNYETPYTACEFVALYFASEMYAWEYFIVSDPFPNNPSRKDDKIILLQDKSFKINTRVSSLVFNGQQTKQDLIAVKRFSKTISEGALCLPLSTTNSTILENKTKIKKDTLKSFLKTIEFFGATPPKHLYNTIPEVLIQ